MDSAVFLAGQQSGYGVFREFSVPQKRQWRSSGQNLRPRKRNKTSHRGGGVSATGRSYDPLRLSELQRLNKIRTCKHFPKRRKSVARVPPRAPFNDSSYLMRVRQSGGLASSPSPATPATPAFVSTPVFASPAPQFQFREGPEGFPEDYGYGSMEGLIHLKAGSDEPSHVSSRSNNDVEADVKDYGYGSMEGLIRLRSRPDEPTLTSSHRLSPGNGLGRRRQLMEARLAEQESHIAYLEDENLTLKERLFLAHQEANELRLRFQRSGSCFSVVDEHDDACSDYASSD
ncbi:uncharacterized protein [Physcomitrium patens]|uniref:PRLI-interacting factor A n=1 Tax=Physcomitrium patens TaxID=3218 RepID=A0A7I4FSA6_PHYPA|nr:uncharacterized protein LOC112283492 isoform X2 [Physcomitrium patens]XP_024377978.1 uncharacterized protein LOC112283492 isoform X2 [Physcomitrium patens]|eukprot:XP_024377977.1 uncharacterized protein LOC112283492 isoform X2 [Physcomitrella patens]